MAKIVITIWDEDEEGDTASLQADFLPELEVGKETAAQQHAVVAIEAIYKAASYLGEVEIEYKGENTSGKN